MPDGSYIVDAERRFLEIEFAVILEQRLTHDQHRDAAVFLDDDIFGIAIHGDIRHIRIPQYLHDLFQSVAVRVGFEHRENGRLRLDGLQIVQVLEQYPPAQPDDIHRLHTGTEQ